MPAVFLHQIIAESWPAFFFRFSYRTLYYFDTPTMETHGHLYSEPVMY